MATRARVAELKTADADVLAKAERVIFAFARREQPESLQDLRQRLVEKHVVIDDRLLNLAILQLLNDRRFALSFDRRLSVKVGD